MAVKGFAQLVSSRMAPDNANMFLKFDMWTANGNNAFGFEIGPIDMTQNANQTNNDIQTALQAQAVILGNVIGAPDTIRVLTTVG